MEMRNIFFALPLATYRMASGVDLHVSTLEERALCGHNLISVSQDLHECEAMRYGSKSSV